MIVKNLVLVGFANIEIVSFHNFAIPASRLH